MSLPGFGVRNPVPVNLLMAALLLAGGFCAVNLRRQFFPDIEPEAATVSLVYPGATPIEIEETMAIKVEDAVAELDEVDKLRTSISEGGGGITVEFREGISDVSKAVDEVER
ncbi:MAG: efflux RND transporter permease subunit, partial [Planctomycetota bacterium]